MVKRLIPLLNRVLVEKIVPPAKTSAGNLLPEKTSKLNSGKVIAVGAGLRNKEGNPIPLSVKEGDTVLLPEYGGTQVKLEEKEKKMSTYMSRLFPKSNSSFFLSRGNALLVDVLRLKEERILVDPGLGTAKICMQDEGVGINNKSIRFENKVGCQNLVASESLFKKRDLERMFIDLVVGDPLNKLRSTARFENMVGSSDAVPGEPHLLLPRRFRQHQAWMELHKASRTNSKVRGFIVRKVRRGYAIAIAGFIAFLPYRPMIRRRISSDRFNIERIGVGKSTTDIVVF